MNREETVDFHIKSTWHSISRMYNQKAAQAENFTSSIGFALININSTDGTPATKIAPLMGLESRSLTRILKTMEEKGLIYKKADPVDRRSVRIFLTEEGLRLKILSVKTINEFNELVRKSLTEEELNVFFCVFKKINKVIEDFSNKPLAIFPEGMNNKDLHYGQNQLNPK
ncbi:MAG TPA: MarR family transcriptional regulator [Cyclobacteriaceae bacterium]|nr:MarR family transcriptional regulator [Cyclobacteriaceae bacterium]